MNDYLKEFEKTCETTNEMILRKWPQSINSGALAWAADNAPDLSSQEKRLYKRVNTEWINNIDIDTYKKTILEWGQTLLKIYKKHFDETKEEQKG